ncbi:MAG: hypothetical protein SNH27_09760 [Rikenellaceae bacterium]
MKRRSLKVSYSDLFEITADYCIDVKKYLRYEMSEVFDTTIEGDIDIFDVYTHRHQIPRGFAVLCYDAESEVFTDMKKSIYDIYFGDRAKGNREIPKESAMKLIDSYNMNLVTRNEFGRIWE